MEKLKKTVIEVLFTKITILLIFSQYNHADVDDLEKSLAHSIAQTQRPMNIACVEPSRGL